MRDILASHYKAARGLSATDPLILSLHQVTRATSELELLTATHGKGLRMNVIGSPLDGGFSVAPESRVCGPTAEFYGSKILKKLCSNRKDNKCSFNLS
ncbi:hypothetical protein TNCV_3381641 [Trichonephila clavipes]|nr:hypothetical protein TNCV_3381641 [Trichonephila clavipes]